MGTGTVSAKGWVVIPQEIRKRYGLAKGDKVHFIDYGGVVAIVPVSTEPLKDAASMLKGDTSLVRSLLRERSEETSRER